jgi:hypothetical protein
LDEKIKIKQNSAIKPLSSSIIVNKKIMPKNTYNNLLEIVTPKTRSILSKDDYRRQVLSESPRKNKTLEVKYFLLYFCRT